MKDGEHLLNYTKGYVLALSDCLRWLDDKWKADPRSIRMSLEAEIRAAIAESSRTLDQVVTMASKNESWNRCSCEMCKDTTEKKDGVQ